MPPSDPFIAAAHAELRQHFTVGAQIPELLDAAAAHPIWGAVMRTRAAMLRKKRSTQNPTTWIEKGISQ
jgi:hypothetical protein